jgi:hypothetical protein
MDDALRPVDFEKLAIEIERYLAAVDAFREAGCVPRWRGERRPQEGSSTERSK